MGPGAVLEDPVLKIKKTRLILTKKNFFEMALTPSAPGTSRGSCRRSGKEMTGRNAVFFWQAQLHKQQERDPFTELRRDFL